jgi:hypothetical protein
MKWLVIIVIAILFWLMKRKRNWRKQAVVLAAVYDNYLDSNFSDRVAFFKALEFRCKPAKLEESSSPSHNKTHNNLIARFAGILIQKDLGTALDKYLKQHRHIDMSDPTTQDVRSSHSSRPKFTYNEGDYSVTEMVYCYLVIEHPKVVAYLPKVNAQGIINNLLTLSRNMIRSTASDPALVRDMEQIERE